MIVALGAVVTGWTIVVLVVSDSHTVTKSAFRTFETVLKLGRLFLTVVSTLGASLWLILSGGAVVALWALVHVRCRDTDDTVESFQTVNTIVCSLASWKRVLALFASRWQLGASEAEETAWAKHFLFVGLRCSSQAVIACIALLGAIIYTLGAVIASWAGCTLIQLFEAILENLSVSAIRANNRLAGTFRAIVRSGTVLGRRCTIWMVTVRARRALAALTHTCHRGVITIRAFTGLTSLTVLAFLAGFTGLIIVGLIIDGTTKALIAECTAARRC